MSQTASLILHRAPWVLPVTAPPIADGAVLVDGGRILAVDAFARLRQEQRGAVTLLEHDDCVLLPALVNAHCHLELSHLADLGDTGAPDGFCGWILRVIAQRGQVSPAEVPLAAAAALAVMRRRGIGLVGDIGKGETGTRLADQDAALCPFREYLGFAHRGAEQALRELAALSPRQLVSAHAPYSTAEQLLLALSQRARAQGAVLPIHLAESPSEMEFFRTGGGPMRDLLEARGAWDGSWRPPPEGNPVFWLDRLGLLDENLLCVHVVQAGSAEVALLAQRRVRLCLCPGSNRVLGVGVAPLPDLLAAGLLPALGSDSLASNSRLCLWREMALLRQEHPGVAPATVFAMATAAGARALMRQGDWGSLAPGCRARFLAVSLPVQGISAGQIYEHLTSSDETVEVRWIGGAP